MTTIPATAASSDSRPVTSWLSSDRQGEIDMTGATAAEALRELLAQCATDDEREGILAGSFVVADAEITDETIEALRAEAAEAGDMEQVALCDAALDGDEAALDACRRVIADAHAQAD